MLSATLGKRSIIAFASLVVVLLGLAGGVYAYDTGREDLIAEGVRVGGVHVGGLRADAARRRLERVVLPALARPVVLEHRQRRFTLTAREARTSVNIARSVAAAVERSRQGSIVTRTVRGLRGSSVPADIPLKIRYSRAAVRREVRRVSEALERTPKDASVQFSGTGVSTTPSHDGRAVDEARLRRQIQRRLADRYQPRHIAVKTRVVRPEVTTDELADRYAHAVLVDRDSFRLRYLRRLQVAKTYVIAVGKVGLETPAGLYNIQNKALNPAWHVPNSDWAGDLAGKVIPGDDPSNPIKARWLGIYDGVGIHGTDAVASLGTRASHGCIRMAIPDVKELYDQVPVGAPVYIA